MNTLVTITNKTIGAETNSVNAKELHSFIQSKSKYADWITRRIKKYDFQENKDYIIIETKKAGNNATLKEYYITLNMAKELSMVENNEKGRQARRWFIEIAEKYQQTIQQPTPKIKELQNIILEQNRIIANTSTDKEIKELKNTIEKQNKIIQTLTDKSYQYCLDVKQMLTNISKQYANDINSLEIQTSQIQAKELAPLLN